MPEYFEEAGSPKESYSVESGWNIERTFIVNWGYRFTLVDDLLAERFYPGNNSAIVADFSFSHIGNDPKPTNAGLLEEEDFLTNTLAYDKVRLTVNYNSGLNATASGGGGGGGGGGADNTEVRDEGGLFEYAVSGTQESFTRQSRAFWWIGGNDVEVPEDVRPLTAISLLEHRLTIAQLTSINWTILDALVGAVNKYPLRMPVSTRLILPQTLMFAPYSVSVEVTKDNLYANAPLRWRLELNLVERCVRNAYFNDGFAVVYDQLGLFSRANVGRGFDDWRREVISTSVDYSTRYYGPPGWNHYWRDVIGENPVPSDNWRGWDKLIYRNGPEFELLTNPDNALTYPIKDFNSMIYGYDFTVDSGPGDTLMNTLYPNLDYGAPA